MGLGIFASGYVSNQTTAVVVSGATTFLVDSTDEGFAQTLTGFFVKATNAESLSVVETTSKTGAQFTIPSEAQVGDLCLVVQYSFNNASTELPTKVIPAGFTEISDVTQDAGNEFRTTCIFKSVVTADPGTSITGMNAESDTKFVLTYRPNSSATYSFGDVNTSSTQGGFNGFTINLPSDTDASDTNPIIVIGVKTNRDDSSAEEATLTGSDDFTATLYRQGESSRDAARVGYYVGNQGRYVQNP